MASLDCEEASLLLPLCCYFYSVICSNANRDATNEKSVHCTFVEQTVVFLREEEEGGDGDDVERVAGREKPPIDMEVEACRWRTDLTLSAPLPLAPPLFIHPPSCLSDAAAEKPHPFHHARPHTEKPSVSR